MIALLKLYKKTIQREENVYEVAGAQPYAIFSDSELQVLNENELISNFPNPGKIFVPDSYPLPQNEYFRFHELIESNTFDISRPYSCRYSLGKEVLNIKLFEVIKLGESIEQNKLQIEKLLSKGIAIPFVISHSVIFKTSDNYLIGPIQMEFSNGVYICKEKEFIPYYQQAIEITTIIDPYKNHDRLFCMENLNTDKPIGWIDVATDQRVISDALKQLKDNTDLAELSRKMIARLKKWYDSDTAQGTYLQERLQRVIKIMEGHTLTEEVIALYTELVLELEVTKVIIKERVQQTFDAEYDAFVKTNKKLIKENSALKKELEQIQNAVFMESNTLETTKMQLAEIQETMYKKIEELQTQFASVYAEQLNIRNLPSLQQNTATSLSTKAQRGFSQFQSMIGKSLSSVNDFNDILNNNLASFRGNDDTGSLAATILTAIVLGEPIIVYSDNSLELAKCITKSVTCEQTLTFIPEIETFTLNELQQQYTQFHTAEAVKSIIIHNPHTTAALYSLPAYFNHNKWVDDIMLPDLTIITIDSLDEALPFLEKMPFAPLIDSMKYMNRSINRRSFKGLQAGQLMLEQVEEFIVVEDSLAIRREFREWIEDNNGLEVEIPSQLVEWLHQINIFLKDNEILFDWCYKIFHKVIKQPAAGGIED